MTPSLTYLENTEMEMVTGILTRNKQLSPVMLTGKVEAFTTSIASKQRPAQMSYLQTFIESNAIDPTSEHKSNLTAKGASMSSSNNNNSDKNTKFENNNMKPRSSSVSSVKGVKQGRRRASSLGDMTEPSTQSLLLNLTTTLNESFPDFDFTNSKLEQFVTKDNAEVITQVNGHFAELTIRQPYFLNTLWTAVDDVVNLKKCEVFEFRPDMNEESQYENIWSFHYFFYNKDDRHLVYLTCAARR
jgi:hypothetical protein